MKRKDQHPQLWLPTHDREPHFDIPSLEALTKTWTEASPNELLVLDESVYGVAENPEGFPSAIVSVDLCEVVRETGVSLLELRGGGIDDMVADGETGQMDYGSTINGWGNEIAQANRQLYLQELMHHDQIRPMPYADAIAAFMRQWQQAGIYVIANTSTLPGCEQSTVRFLHEHYPGCFRGILFPRNHDGNGTTTKAMALNAVSHAIQRELGIDANIPAIGIDDAMHHANDLDAAGADVFVPAYAWNEKFDDHDSITRVGQVLGTVDTFIAADQRLAAIVQERSIAA